MIDLKSVRRQHKQVISDLEQCLEDVATILMEARDLIEGKELTEKPTAINCRHCLHSLGCHTSPSRDPGACTIGPCSCKGFQGENP